MPALGDAGRQGDPRLVRLGYTASAPLRYAFLLAADEVRALASRQARHADVEPQGQVEPAPR
jgi:hypothetical protein